MAALTLVLFSSACVPAVNPEFQGVVDVTYPLVDVGGSPYCTATKIDTNLFLTAAHCLGNPTGGLILGKDGVLKAFTVVKADEDTDLALISAEAPGPAAKVYQMDVPQYDRVIAAGYPYGVALYITEGLWIGDSWQPSLANHAHVSTPVGPGNSGGGIFIRTADGSWQLVAVVQMRAKADAHIGIVSKQSVLKGFLK